AEWHHADIDGDLGRELRARLHGRGAAERRLCGVADPAREESGRTGREHQRDEAWEMTDHGRSFPQGQVNGRHVNVQPIRPTLHCATRSASPMLQLPSPLTSQASGWNGAVPQPRRPTLNCATKRASPMLTMPSPLMSPHRTGGGGVVVVGLLAVGGVVVGVGVGGGVGGGGVVVVVGDVLVVDVVVGRVVVVVETARVPAEARASIRPKPLASSNPGAPMSTAPRVSAACTSAGVSVGSRSRSSAATPAECGAAADVPKKAQKGGHEGNPPAVEIATPSTPTSSGLARAWS